MDSISHPFGLYLSNAALAQLYCHQHLGCLLSSLVHFWVKIFDKDCGWCCNDNYGKNLDQVVASASVSSSIEPKFKIPHSAKIYQLVIANGLIGSVLSDYFWALCVVWTTPLVATLGMSLTIPLAMVADMMIHGRHYSAIYILGSAQVFAGFVIANLPGKITKKIGL